MKRPENIAGVILAGGGSRRMNGQDKSWMDLAGRPLLSHVVAAVSEQVKMLAINAGRDDPRLQRFNVPILPDVMPGGLGPMVGVLTAMAWAQEKGATHVLTAPTDTPFLPADLVQRLSDHVPDAPNLPVIACSNKRLHPVVGLWPVCLRAQLQSDIETGHRRIGLWARSQKSVEVEFAMPFPPDPFLNINTPDDLSKAKMFLD